jgi:hypothetical protein
MPLRAPGPNPILLSPVQPSAAVRAWYARRLDAQITSMHQHVQVAIQGLWETNQPVHVATFPAHVLGGLLDRLEAHYVEQFNLRASEVVHGFLHRCLDHVDFAFGASLRKAGFQVAARGPLTYDALAMDEFEEDLHPRDDHGRFAGSDWTGPCGNQELSTRIPKETKTRKNDPEHVMLKSDLQALRDAPALNDKSKTPWEKIAECVSSYPNFQAQPGDTPDRIIERYINDGVKNLQYLYDRMSPEDRDRAMQWYDGAHDIATGFAQKFGLSTAQASAAIATLSPKRDWRENVSLAERYMDIMHDHQGARWDSEMSKFSTEAGAKDFANKEVMSRVEGKTLGELNSAADKALWLIAYDGVHNERGFREISPEGKFGEFVKKDDGSLNNIGGASVVQVAHMVQVYEHGDARTISDALGDGHKVRNFYNNIYNPNSTEGHVTIDTHAVAGILLRPLGLTDNEVTQNFGGGKPAVSEASTGIKGTYCLNQEVFKRAAELEHLLPRQMQSICWTSAQTLFTTGFKHSDGEKKVSALWQKYHDSKGAMSLGQLHKEISEASGKKIERPSWANRAPSEKSWPSTYERKLAPSELPVHADSRAMDARGRERIAAFFTKTPAVTMDATTMPPKIPFIKRKDLWGHLALKFEMTPSMRRALAERLDDNVGLISTKPNKGGTISRQYFGLIRDRVYKSINKGRDLTGLTEDLHEALGITRRRAGLIARDQNNKATSLFVRTRQKEIGINKAQWMHTAASIHPRLEHEGWDGMPYLVDEGMQSMEEGEQQWPGSAINCGCLSMPIIPGYNDEGDEYSTLKDDEEEAG